MELPSVRTPFSVSSKVAQNRYQNLVLAEIALVVAIASVAAAVVVAPSNSTFPVALAVVAVLFFFTILVRLYTGSARLDRKWFTYRAVAESMKTLSWQFAMGTGEFPLESNSADSDFRERLGDVERGSSFPPFPSTVPGISGPTIPHSMLELRSRPWTERRTIYVSDRVDDQIKWYLKAGKRNSSLSTRYSWLVLALQIAGVVIAFAILTQRASAELGIVAVALIAVLIPSFIAWTQVKQYSELVEPYLATHAELKELREKIIGATTELAFLEEVDQTELAISREHTTWLAKRGIR
jgi:hypothetical protein